MPDSQPDAEPFLEALHHPDPQTRLNAVVRLAYLGRADGLDALLDGLAHESPSTRFHQVPDALALLPHLGPAGGARLEQLVKQPGPARLGAARALLLRGRLKGVPQAVAALLAEPDHATRWWAAVLAGEIGPPAEVAATPLRRLLRDGGPEIAIAAQALTAVAGATALPDLRHELHHPAEARRIAAMRALAALGTAAADTAGRLLDVLTDSGRTLAERLAAAQAAIRVTPSGDSLLAALLNVLPHADRWLAVGLLRTVAQLGPQYPLRPEASDHWPAWESRLVLRSPVARLETSGDLLLRTLIDLLHHPDHDLRRTAALGLALFGPAGREAAPAVQTARLPDPLRHDVLRRLGVPSVLDPAGFPWDLSMLPPPLDLDSIAPDCESLFARARATPGPLEHTNPVPKWAFLHYLVERRGLLLHGSRTPGLDVLRPISRSGGGTRISDQPGLFAVDHALMAMYFGIMDRTQVPTLSNALYDLHPPLPLGEGWGEGSAGRGEGSSDRHPLPSSTRAFRLGADFIALAARPFVDATVYVLPPDTFSQMGEWTSLVPVRPLTSLSITPQDFPLLEYLWGTELGPLASQFADDHPALQDVSFWATKRSTLSAQR